MGAALVHSGPGEHHWEIVEEERFRRERDEINDCRRMDEVLEGVTWALSRDPLSCFPIVPGTAATRLAKTRSFPGAPALHIWFTVQGAQVRLQSIELVVDLDE